MCREHLVHLRTRLRHTLSVVMVAAVVCLPDVRALAAHANYVDTDFWVADGPVRAIVEVDGVIYLGGSFSRVGPNIGRLAAIKTTTGSVDPLFPSVNGDVFAVIPDGFGGWYVGGEFFAVGGVFRNDVAHITSDGTTDIYWQPEVSENTSVFALALSPDGSTVYLGGNFTTIYGTARVGIAAVDATTAALTPWNPNAGGGNIDTRVKALAVNGNTVYAGGDFYTIGGQARNFIAALDATTGLATAWNPNADNLVSALEISADGQVVYAGGTFTNIGGQARSRFARLWAATGLALGPPTADANAEVRTMALSGDGTVLYVGGVFTNIGGQARNRIAAIAASGNGFGTVTPWNPNADDKVDDVLAAGPIVYVAGGFQNIGGQARRNLAAINAVTGLATFWNPDANHVAKTLALSGNVVCAGGLFTSLGGVTRANLAALDTVSGQPTAWNPGANGEVRDLEVSSDGSTLYVGGDFTTISGQARNGLAALNLASGAATALNPAATFLGGPGQAYKLLLSPTETTLYAAGIFNVIGGQNRVFLAELSTTTGLATAWNPSPNGLPIDLELSGDGSLVYAGGAFFNIGGQDRNKIAALSTATGLATAWNPGADNNVRELELSPDGATIYAAGQFTNIGGQARTAFAKLDVGSGLATAWNPAAAPGSVGMSLLNAADGSTLYLGGAFFFLGNQMRICLARADATTGVPTTWQTFTFGAVTDILESGPTLYVSGEFKSVFTSSVEGLAVFHEAPTVQFAAATSAVSEAQGPTNIPLVLSEPAPVMLGVDFTITGGTATNNADYQVVSIYQQYVFFFPGQTSVPIVLTPFDDGLSEPDETVQITISDPSPPLPPTAQLGALTTHTVTIRDAVYPSNDGLVPPTADDQNVTTAEDTPVQITLSGSSPYGQPLIYQVVESPAHGVLSGEPPDALYTPDRDYAGTDAFTFIVVRGNLSSDPATVSITVTPAPDLPVARTQEITVEPDGSARIVLRGSDPDDTSVVFIIVDGPEHGQLLGTGPELIYVADAGFAGTDQFTFMVMSGQEASEPATVTLVVDPPPDDADDADDDPDDPDDPDNTVDGDDDPDGGDPDIEDPDDAQDQPDPGLPDDDSDAQGIVPIDGPDDPGPDDADDDDPTPVADDDEANNPPDFAVPDRRLCGAAQPAALLALLTALCGTRLLRGNRQFLAPF